MKGARHNSHLLLVTIIFASFISCNAGLLRHITNVYVKNGLDGGLDLTLHCKSKNDDLGVQLLHPQQEFKFTFRPNFWGTTQFFCSFAWNGGIHWFDIYIDNRDYDRCKDCYWLVNLNGPCLMSDTGKYDICYKYNQV